MKLLKYILFIAGIVIVECSIVYGLYFFAGMSKSLYVLFSSAVILFIVFYLIYGRYREEIKIRHKNEVRKKYFKRAFSIVIFICVLTAGAILISGSLFLVSRAFRG